MTKQKSSVRRFCLLGGEHYYAGGGFHDFIESFDTLAVAVKLAAALAETRAIDWWHVWDCVSRTIVAASTEQAYGGGGSPPEVKAVIEDKIAAALVGTCMELAVAADKFGMAAAEIEKIMTQRNHERCAACGVWCGTWEFTTEDGEVDQDHRCMSCSKR